jgi:hypothetical protein
MIGNADGGDITRLLYEIDKLLNTRLPGYAEARFDGRVHALKTAAEGCESPHSFDRLDAILDELKAALARLNSHDEHRGSPDAM